MKRFLVILCIAVLCLSMAPTALAASKSNKGTNTITFSVTTSKKDATLTISPNAGKVTGTAWKNILKGTTKTVTKKAYGDYSITVSAPGKATVTKKMSSYKVKISLEKNTTYRITISYTGINFFDTSTIWNTKWKTVPGWKASVNKGAKFK